MFYLLIDTVTYSFDLFIILTYMNNILGERRQKFSPYFFYGAYLFMEVILFTNEYLTASLPNEPSIFITNLVSFSTTFALTFLYRSSLLSKVFTSLCFQLLVVISEYVFTMIMNLIRPTVFQHITPMLNTTMNLGSKVILFFFTLAVSLFFGKSFRNMNRGYQTLTFSTPIASLVIMLFTPLENISQSNNQSFFLIIYLCLATLNIANYVLLRFNYHQTSEIFYLKQMERLAAYQQEKYEQLSSAYKANRSLIHDTKKHYFVIRKYLENKEYQKLAAYLDVSMQDMEHTYSEVNTGNLVIDSFVGNYKNICSENHIKFHTNISIDPNRIPIHNYDLCIILGNLLDNAVNACKQNTCVSNYIKLTITSHDNDLFYIHIQNTYHHAGRPDHIPPHNNDLTIPEHGYGLDNIKRIAENNHATFHIDSEDLFTVDIVFPVIDVRMRISPPALHSSQT